MAQKFSYTLNKNASKVHKAIVQYFKTELYGFNISQNHAIKIDNKTLYADIYCNSPLNFIIEIQGEQHFKFIPHFHKSMANFKKACTNDCLKKEWAELNDFIYIAINVKNFDIDNFKKDFFQKLKCD